MSQHPPAPSARISALVHTRNEERWLPGCLESLRWADEIIVADMASTDATREIARSAGALLLDMPVAPFVEQVRNLALEKCAGDWLLLVDADERVPATLAARLRELAYDSHAATVAAYALPRRNEFLGVWLEHGFWPDHQTRFFRRGAAHWSGEIHEPPVISGGALVPLPAEPALALEHPGYGPDLEKFIEKLARYSAIDARRLSASTNPPVWPWLLRRPASEFTNRYFHDGAWRHGAHGLIWSLLQGAYQLMVAANFWANGRERAAAFRVAPADLRGRVRRELWRSAAKLLQP
ncbi:MAG: glycosyltransferase family 2 protein [Verrucomicrobia bacterium]|nr:glycosyltransferase family 2 protein [Verrucomicrobiota bacterium]